MQNKKNEPRYGKDLLNKILNSHINGHEEIQKILNKPKLSFFDWLKLERLLLKYANKWYDTDYDYEYRMDKYVGLKYQSKICRHRAYRKIGLRYKELEEGNYYV